MMSQLGVLYDVTAGVLCALHTFTALPSRTATRDVTVGRGGEIAQQGNVTCLQFNSRDATRDVPVRGGGGGLHIAQPGNVTCLRFNSRDATRDVTVWGGGYTLHNWEAPFIIQL